MPSLPSGRSSWTSLGVRSFKSCLAVGSSDRFFYPKKAFVRVSVYVFACVCMRFCMFVSAFLMRSYVHSCAFALSCMCGLLTASCSSCMLCLCGSCLAGGSSDRTVPFFGLCLHAHCIIYFFIFLSFSFMSGWHSR